MSRSRNGDNSWRGDDEFRVQWGRHAHQPHYERRHDLLLMRHHAYCFSSRAVRDDASQATTTKSTIPSAAAAATATVVEAVAVVVEVATVVVENVVPTILTVMGLPMSNKRRLLRIRVSRNIRMGKRVGRIAMTTAELDQIMT